MPEQATKEAAEVIRREPGDGRLAYSDADLDRAGLLSRKTRWRLRREGKFPEPRRVGGRNLWPADEIRQWIESQPRAGAA